MCKGRKFFTPLNRLIAQNSVDRTRSLQLVARFKAWRKKRPHCWDLQFHPRDAGSISARILICWAAICGARRRRWIAWSRKVMVLHNYRPCRTYTDPRHVLMRSIVRRICKWRYWVTKSATVPLVADINSALNCIVPCGPAWIPPGIFMSAWSAAPRNESFTCHPLVWTQSIRDIKACRSRGIDKCTRSEGSDQSHKSKWTRAFHEIFLLKKCPVRRSP